MTYYKVIGKYDGTQITKTGRWHLYIDRFLIANELYTPGELKKLLNGATLRGNGITDNTQVFEQVDINRNDTYWMFGARFAGVLK